MMKGHSFFLVTLLISLILSGSGHTEENMDIKALLREPGVKLVVVEFYSAFCEPCIKAAPKWEELNRKYFGQGLRLVVISIMEEKEKCSVIEWTPYKSICDSSGTYQSAYGVKTLPQAFLYSWQGNILAERAGVEQVERAVENYFKHQQYTIEVNDVDVRGDKYAISSNWEPLRKYIIGQISAKSKFSVVVPAATRMTRVPAGRKCEVDIPPNSVLHITLSGDVGGNRKLQLEVEKYGCVHASATMPYFGKGFEEDKDSLFKAADLAVDVILDQLINVRKPKPQEAFVGSTDGLYIIGAGGMKANIDDGSAIRNPVVDQHGFLMIDSDPSGATIVINGVEEGVTPAQFRKMVGDYVVVCSKGDLYHPGSQKITLTGEGGRLSFHLKPNFGILDVKSEPEGADIEINGEPTGHKTPYIFPPKKTGAYAITLRKKNHFSRKIDAILGEGNTTSVEAVLEKNYSALTVKTDPPGAEVVADGVSTGVNTPTVLGELTAGVHEIEVRHPQYYTQKRTVVLERSKPTTESFRLEGKYGLLEIMTSLVDEGRKTPVVASVYIGGVNVGKTPFKKKLLVGDYSIEVKHDEGYPFEKSARIDEGKIFLLNAELKKRLSSEILAERQAIVERKRIACIDWGISLIVIGGLSVGVGGGTGLGLAAGIYADDVYKAKDMTGLKAARDKQLTAERVGWATIGVGAGLIVGGILLIALAPSKPETLSSAGIDAGPFKLKPEIAIGGNGGVLKLDGEF